MELAKIKQRLEILWNEVEKLEAAGGGGSPTDAYTKAQTDALLNTKADKSTTYTKTEVDYEIDSEVGTAIAALDVNSTAATGHVIRSIAQEDGKIAAVAELVDTTPTTGSTKLCTSGGIYEAIQAAGGGGTDLTPVYVGAKASTFPEDKISVLQKHLPFTTTETYPTNDYGPWFFISEDNAVYFYGRIAVNNKIIGGAMFLQEARIVKATREWTQSSSKQTYSIITDKNREQVFTNYTISGGTDLNGAGTGYYFANVNASLVNSPTTDAFILFTSAATNNYKYQTIITMASTPEYYYRVCVSNNWTVWQKITATPVS